MDRLSSQSVPIAELAQKYKITSTQVQRLAVTAQFITLGLSDPEGDPEAGDAKAKALRLRIKQRLYKQSLCEPRGIGLVEDLGEAKEGGSSKGQKRRAAPTEEEEKSAAEAEAEKMVRVGSAHHITNKTSITCLIIHLVHI